MQSISSWLWSAAQYVANTRLVRTALVASLKPLSGYLKRRLQIEQLEANNKITLSDLEFDEVVRHLRNYILESFLHLLVCVLTSNIPFNGC